jgi:hypothetical protein
MKLLTRHFFFQVISLELSTGIPMLYIFKEGKFIRRGSPAGPSEAGVYAYTKVRYVSQLEIVGHNKILIQSAFLKQTGIFRSISCQMLRS